MAEKPQRETSTEHAPRRDSLTRGVAGLQKVVKQLISSASDSEAADMKEAWKFLLFLQEQEMAKSSSASVLPQPGFPPGTK